MLEVKDEASFVLGLGGGMDIANVDFCKDLKSPPPSSVVAGVGSEKDDSSFLLSFTAPVLDILTKLRSLDTNPVGDLKTLLVSSLRLMGISMVEVKICKVENLCEVW